MCASSTPKAHLSHAANQKTSDIDSDVNQTSVWQNPMVISFTIVGILFVLSVILGALNFYIWYIERRKRRHHNGLDRFDRLTSGYGGTSYESSTPKTRSTNLAFVFMGRGRNQDNGQSKLTRQSSMAANR